MAKFVDDAALDALLDEIATGDLMVICEGQPASYAEAIQEKGASPAGKRLADVALTPGDGNGDFTIANGDASGRKVTVTQQTGVTIDVTGTADHIAIVDTGNSQLLLVTTVASQSVTAANTATINAFDAEVADAA